MGGGTGGGMKTVSPPPSRTPFPLKMPKRKQSEEDEYFNGDDDQAVESFKE